MGNPLLVRCFQPTSPGLSYLSAACRPWFNREALHSPDLKCMKLINTLLNQGSVTVSDNPHWLRTAWKFPVSWDSIIKLQREFKLLKMGLDSPCSTLEMSFLPHSSSGPMWLWGSRPHPEEQVLCLPSLWQLCSQSQPPWGWSSLFPSHPDLGAHFLASSCYWAVLNQWCLQARLWTVPVCIHFLCCCGQTKAQPSFSVFCFGCPQRWVVTPWSWRWTQSS